MYPTPILHGSTWALCQGEVSICLMPKKPSPPTFRFGEGFASYLHLFRRKVSLEDAKEALAALEKWGLIRRTDPDQEGPIENSTEFERDPNEYENWKNYGREMAQRTCSSKEDFQRMDTDVELSHKKKLEAEKRAKRVYS